MPAHLSNVYTLYKIWGKHLNCKLNWASTRLRLQFCTTNISCLLLQYFIFTTYTRFVSLNFTLGKLRLDLDVWHLLFGVTHTNPHTPEWKFSPNHQREVRTKWMCVMRIQFPHWSSRENKSLWMSFHFFFFVKAARRSSVLKSPWDSPKNTKTN